MEGKLSKPWASKYLVSSDISSLGGGGVSGLQGLGVPSVLQGRGLGGCHEQMWGSHL